MTQFKPWTKEEDNLLLSAIAKQPAGKKSWSLIMEDLPLHISRAAARNRLARIQHKQQRQQLPEITCEEYEDAMQTLDTEREEELKALKANLCDTALRITKLSVQMEATNKRIEQLMSRAA